MLDRLEGDLADARAALDAGRLPHGAPWAAPAVVYDLPPALRPRATALCGAQEQLASDLASAMVRTRALTHRTGREQALAQHVQAATTQAPRPVYLDLEA